ncbi:MAG: riboflavin kinase [Candidatus Sungbacteria bacterium]|nr:riboflavin kinase [Candidatus Sungbacteria bacterium]
MWRIRKRWISGAVVRGDGRGRQLGFPTANLVLDKPSKKPREGIWACWVRVKGEKHMYQGVMHVGPRPTIPGALESIEIHIIGETTLDLYGKKLLFSPVKHLREVQKFNSLEELTLAVQQDIHDAAAFLQERSSF